MAVTSRLFTKEQQQSIDAAVAAAESQTSAEIVPAIAVASGRYDRPEDIFGLWVGGTVMATLFLLVPNAEYGTGYWGGFSAFTKLAFMLTGLVLGFVIGTTAAGMLPRLRRPFTPRSQMDEEVSARARQVFYDGRVYKTDKNLGVLIYFSLYERAVVILADDRVIEAIGIGFLNELCDTASAALPGNDVTVVMCNTIKTLGDKLAATLPRQPDDIYQLPNNLLLVD